MQCALNRGLLRLVRVGRAPRQSVSRGGIVVGVGIGVSLGWFVVCVVGVGDGLCAAGGKVWEFKLNLVEWGNGHWAMDTFDGSLHVSCFEACLNCADVLREHLLCGLRWLSLDCNPERYMISGLLP